MNTIEQLFEIDDNLQKLENKRGQDCYQKLIDWIRVLNLQEDKQSILNQLWQEIYEVGIELSKKSALEKLITQLFKH
jgi:hypothetical protein